MIITIYSDASTLKQDSNRSGVGLVVTMYGEVYKTVGMYVGKLTNVNAELLGLLLALKEAREIDYTEELHLVRICSDCLPAIDLACGDANPAISNRAAVAILDKIDELTQSISCPIEYQWVRAHNGNKYNEMADELAYHHAHSVS
ncbi:MAG: RNase H family protein [Rhodospirillales bacterium]